MAPCQVTDDYYQILGVLQSAGKDAIRASYKRLALLHHPDRNPNNPKATAQFQLIESAYSTLFDPDQRRIYDAQYASIRAQRGYTANTSSKSNPTQQTSDAKSESSQKFKEQVGILSAALQQLHLRRSKLESELSEVQREFTRSQDALNRLQSEADKDAQEEAQRKSWFGYFFSARQSEEEKEERQRRMLNNRAARTVREAELKSRIGMMVSKQRSIGALNMQIRQKTAEKDALHQQEKAREEAARWAEEIRQGEAMRREMERQERERQEKERQEWERQYWAKQEEGREYWERQENERIEKQRRENQRRERERKEQQRKEKGGQEWERGYWERGYWASQWASQEWERGYWERQEWETREKERQEEEKKEKERKEKERERKEEERREKERQEEERREKERREKERKEKERQEEERREKEKKQRERIEEIQQRLRDMAEELQKEQEAQRFRDLPQARKAEKERQATINRRTKPKTRRGNKSKSERTKPEQSTGATTSKTACLHQSWWEREPGKHVCERCSTTMSRFAFRCPSCRTVACAKCRDVMKSKREILKEPTQ